MAFWLNPPDIGSNPKVIVLGETATGHIYLADHGAAGDNFVIQGPPGVSRKCAATAPAAISIVGFDTDQTGAVAASNVLVSGIEIEMVDHGGGLYASENAGDGVTTQTGRATQTFQHKGTVHWEGIWIHGPNLCDVWDNWAVNCYTQWQYSRWGDASNPIQFRYIGVSGYNTTHPDGFSIDRGKGLVANQIDMWPAYQALFNQDDGTNRPIGPLEYHNVAINACRVVLGNATCTQWDFQNATDQGDVRDVLSAYSVQTATAAQTHAAAYTSSTIFQAALATYKCDSTPAFVKNLGRGQTSTAGSTYAITTTASGSSGNTIIAVVGSRTVAPTSISGGGLTWTKDAGSYNATETSGVAIFRAAMPSGLSSGTTITITFPSSDKHHSITLGEFSGIASSSPLDKTATLAQNTHSTSAIVGPTAATSQNSELVISAWIAGFAPGGTLSPTVLNAPNPLQAAQLVWVQYPSEPLPVVLNNVYVDLATNGVTGTLDTHCDVFINHTNNHPTLNGDGSVTFNPAWEITAADGSAATVLLGRPPGGDFTLAGGVTGGPGQNYVASPIYNPTPPPIGYKPLVYYSPTSPAGTFAAPPGTIVIVTDGTVWTKQSGTDTSGWVET